MAPKSLMFMLVPFMNLLVFVVCKINNEEFLEPLDKSVVKVIKTERGDIYDCVDFYKQPSLQHPSLRHHNFHPQMRPSSSPKRMRTDDISRQVQELDVRLKDGGCPIGSVPISRMVQDKFTQSKNNSNLTSSRTEPNSVLRQPGTIFALAQKQSEAGKKTFNGVGAYISVYNPKVVGDQYSSAEIIIQDGPDTIEVGWTVNPAIYKDNGTRLFVYTIAGNTHCFNSQCGFVIVNTEIPLDMELYPVSVAGGEIYEYPFFIYQDEKNGNWWLELGLNSAIIGFWPQRFFSGLAQSASYVACGGEAYMPPGARELKPEMGSGYRAFWGNPKTEAFCERFVLVNEAHQVVKAEGTEKFSNDKDYMVNDNPAPLRPEHYVLFGGPAPWLIT